MLNDNVKDIEKFKKKLLKTLRVCPKRRNDKVT